MRAYTAEQQARLGVDEEGKPTVKKAVTSSPSQTKDETKQTENKVEKVPTTELDQPAPKEATSEQYKGGWSPMFACLGMVVFSALVVGIAAMMVRRRRRSELEATYSALQGPMSKPVGSEGQL